VVVLIACSLDWFAFYDLWIAFQQKPRGLSGRFAFEPTEKTRTTEEEKSLIEQVRSNGSGWRNGRSIL